MKIKKPFWLKKMIVDNPQITDGKVSFDMHYEIRKWAFKLRVVAAVIKILIFGSF